jgi:hypothetical protein
MTSAQMIKKPQTKNFFMVEAKIKAIEYCVETLREILV